MELPKPNVLRNYLYEYVLIGLTSAVVFLFYILIDLQKFIRTDEMQMNVQQQQVIRDNTNTLQQFMNYQRGIFPTNDKKQLP